MHHRTLITLLLGGMAVFLLGSAPTIAAPPATPPATPPNNKPIPPFAEVRQAVMKYFQARPDFQPGELITQDDVAPLLAQLQRTWLSTADAQKLLEKVPVKGEFLVNQLSTPDGRKFMRSIAGYPDGYDRLDRLSRMPHGQQTVSALVRGPGGEKMIEYMTKTSGGKELGKQLSNAPDGRNFNAPTGRIYTAAMLLDSLHECHTAAINAAEDNATVASPMADEPRPAKLRPENTTKKRYP